MHFLPFVCLILRVAVGTLDVRFYGDIDRLDDSERDRHCCVINEQKYPVILRQSLLQALEDGKGILLAPYLEVAPAVAPFLQDVAALAMRGVRACFVTHLLLLQEFACEHAQVLSQIGHT